MAHLTLYAPPKIYFWMLKKGATLEWFTAIVQSTLNIKHPLTFAFVIQKPSGLSLVGDNSATAKNDTNIILHYL